MISAVVAVVLTVLITIAGVTIIWIGILPMFQNQLDSVEGLDVELFVDVASGYTVYDADDEVASVQIRRRSDEAEFDKVRIIFYSGGDSISVTKEAPSVNSAVTYVFDFSGEENAPEEVAVVPIYANGEGSISSKVKIPVGVMSEKPDEDDLIIPGDGDDDEVIPEEEPNLDLDDENLVLYLDFDLRW